MDDEDILEAFYEFSSQASFHVMIKKFSNNNMSLI